MFLNRVKWRQREAGAGAGWREEWEWGGMEGFGDARINKARLKWSGGSI